MHEVTLYNTTNKDDYLAVGGFVVPAYGSVAVPAFVARHPAVAVKVKLGVLSKEPPKVMVATPKKKAKPIVAEGEQEADAE